MENILGNVEGTRAHRLRLERTTRATTKSVYNAEDGYVYSCDRVSGKKIPDQISGRLVAAYQTRMEAKYLNAIVKAVYGPDFL